jgi:tetratricopeptide (TPR) repeat protein
VSVRAVGGAGIAALQKRLREVPADWHTWAALGAEYVQEGRRSGDPTYYPKAEQVLRKSLHVERADNFEAMTGLGMLAAARHDFAAALRWADRARKIDPNSSAVYGVRGDALIELGRYKQGFAALQRMVDLRPGLASYARASYAWELQGQTRNAIDSMKLAAQAASTPADAAFADYYLGELYWNAGNLGAAAASYEASDQHDASFVPASQGLAKVAAARGRLNDAIRGYESIVVRLPLPQYVAELYDLYEVAGRTALAKQTAALLDVQRKLFRANGVNVDIDQATFYAEHRGSRDHGLAAARSEWHRRKSVVVADALAWALHANGRDVEALGYSQQALRLGTRNASFLFHKGMIERSLGRHDAAHRDIAEAFAINPHFSFVWAPKVPSILEGLR